MNFSLHLESIKNRLFKTILILPLVLFVVHIPEILLAGERIWVPIRWCGVEGAPSMDNPGVVNELTADDVLWRRHERPTDEIYHDFVNMTFRAGATAAIKNGPQSFPIIRDPNGTGGDLINGTENSDAVVMCRRAWTMGDPLYYEQSNNSVINDGQDTLLSTDSPTVGAVGLGHDGASLNPVPGDVAYVDVNTDGNFDIGERIYRDENTNGVVDAGDTLLVNTLGTTVGDIDGNDLGLALLSVPGRVKYLDLIRQPINTFNIGYPDVQGITSVNANDVEFTNIEFPVHGVAASGLYGLGVAMDDPSQYLIPGPDYKLFETQLVGHEFGHSMGLQHGDGNDDDNNGVLDDGDDDTAPVPGAGPGTLCDSNNVMSYCWLDNGTSGNPNLQFIGVGAPTSGILTTAQADLVREFVLDNVSDRIVDPVTPPLVWSRVDDLGEVKSPQIDIAEISLRVDAERSNLVLSVQTRRPFPKDYQRTLDIHYLIDADGNVKTGGAAKNIAETATPSDFTGIEYAGHVRYRGSKIIEQVFHRFEPETGKFVPLLPRQVRAVRETVYLTPDFPFGRRFRDPDGVRPKPVQKVAIKEVLSLIVPIEFVDITEKSKMRAEYIAQDVEGGTLDRARSSGLNFNLPVFPECSTEPSKVLQGGTTTVTATGMLPNSPVHLLLGENEVGKGLTDKNGSVTINMEIPEDAKVGERLVTVGSLAVSADCSVKVEKDGEDDRQGERIPIKPRYRYAIHYQCGESSESFQEGVVKGKHETLITLSNPSLGRDIRFAKRAIRALPEQKSGSVSPYQVGVIKPGHSIGIECNEIRRMLPASMTAQFRYGTLQVYSEEKIDATVTYTARPRKGEVSSMDFQSIEPQKLLTEK